MPLPETPGHSRANLGQSLVGLLLLSLVSWCAQVSVCVFQESISPVLCKFWQLYGGVNGNLLQEGLCHYQVCCTQSPCLCSSPLLTCTSMGDTQTQFCLSVWGLLVLLHTRFIWAPWASLLGMGFDSKCNFAPPTIFLGFLLCPWMWDGASKSLQCCTATSPATKFLLGLLCPWTRDISSQSLQYHAAATPVPSTTATPLWVLEKLKFLAQAVAGIQNLREQEFKVRRTGWSDASVTCWLWNPCTPAMLRNTWWQQLRGHQILWKKSACPRGTGKNAVTPLSPWAVATLSGIHPSRGPHLLPGVMPSAEWKQTRTRHEPWAVRPITRHDLMKFILPLFLLLLMKYNKTSSLNFYDV